MNINIGDTITFSILGRPGTGKIIRQEITEPGKKYGESVPTVGVESVLANKVVFDLDSGHFIYSYQVRTINGVKVAA